MEGGEVSVDCQEEAACNTTFFAKNGTNVDFSCDGSYACESAIIEMKDTSTFSIICNGQDACESLKCICQDNSGCEKSGI